MKGYSTYLKKLDVKYHLHSQTNAITHANFKELLMITRGDGVYVKDVDDKSYIEAMSGLWYANLGFSNKQLIDAVVNQLNTLPVYHTFNHRSNDVCTLLAEKIAHIVPLQDPRIFYVNSGSEAIDTMIKAAWYYHFARGESSRQKLISNHGAFHGSSIFGAVVGGLQHMKRGFNLPAADMIVQVSAPSMYRSSYVGECETDFCDRLIAEIAEVIEIHGADNIAAMIAEPILGAGGVLIPPKGYFEKLSVLLHSNGILLLMDEVICGFGRTGNWFGSETYGAKPDMIAMAKGLTAGYIPMGAVAICGKVYEAIALQSNKLGVFGHGYTYSGHPVSSAVALAALNIYHKMDAPTVTLKKGNKLQKALAPWMDDPLIGDIRCGGFIVGIELVADKTTRTPFSPQQQVGHCFERNAVAEGLIVRNMNDTIALCPPYIINDDEFDEMMERLNAALEATKICL